MGLLALSLSLLDQGQEDAGLRLYFLDMHLFGDLQGFTRHRLRLLQVVPLIVDLCESIQAARNIIAILLCPGFAEHLAKLFGGVMQCSLFTAYPGQHSARGTRVEKIALLLIKCQGLKENSACLSQVTSEDLSCAYDGQCEIAPGAILLWEPGQRLPGPGHGLENIALLA